MVREFQKLSERNQGWSQQEKVQRANSSRTPPTKPPRPNRQLQPTTSQPQLELQPQRPMSYPCSGHLVSGEMEFQVLQELDKSIEDAVTIHPDEVERTTRADVSVNTDFLDDTISEDTASNGHSESTCVEDHRHQHRASCASIEGALVATSPTTAIPTSTNDPRADTHFVVVAIDFGTTFSGYAFSFVSSPRDVHVMRKWEGGDPGADNRKTPTILLLKPTGEFHSFGFTARDAYHNLDSPEAHRWLYFDKFKMVLHRQKNLSRDTEVTAANGVSVPALTVFAHSLRYFKEHALEELSDQSATRIYNEDVRWVVTVPAIWRPSAKQFMRQAAYEAGIASPSHPQRLLIALEPEAASIHCRSLRVNQLALEVPDRSTSLEDRSELAVDKLRAGSRYMIVDCGGGTVDITVHEIADDKGTLKELHKATGGAYGSIGVDLEFEKLMAAVFGVDFMEQFREWRPAGFVELMMAFEYRKRTANPFHPTPSNISLPFSFITYHKKRKKYGVDVAIKRFGRDEIRWSSQGMLRLDPGMMHMLFQPALDNICANIRGILDKVKGHAPVRYLFLVGGFAESPILQQRIRKEFSSLLKVVIPQGVSLAIVKGAVQYGLNPSVVNVRRSRGTYGIGILHRFVDGEHPPHKRIVTDDGVDYCADIFDKFVSLDQSVGIGDVVLRRYTPARAGQASITMHVYSGEGDACRFVSDEGVQRCGTLYLDLQDVQAPADTPREIHVMMTFGDTEVKVQAVDLVSGRNVRAIIDFLGGQ